MEDRRGHGAEEPQGRPVARLDTGQEVSRKLPLHKLVIGQIVVEGANYEVAKVIRGRPIVVVFEAVTLGEAGQVEPVPRPALTKMR